MMVGRTQCLRGEPESCTNATEVCGAHPENRYASLSFFVSEGTLGTFEILGESWPSKFNGNVAIAFEKTQDFID